MAGMPSNALKCAGASAGQAGLRWVAGWAGPEASLSHKAAKPWVGCWLPVAPGTWAGRAGLSCAWAGCWMGKAIAG